jgi:hypothetical protein
MLPITTISATATHSAPIVRYARPETTPKWNPKRPVVRTKANPRSVPIVRAKAKASTQRNGPEGIRSD